MCFSKSSNCFCPTGSSLAILILFENPTRANHFQSELKVLRLPIQIYAIYYCQRASRAKMQGWRGGRIIEPYEDSIQAIQISSVCKRCSVRIIGPVGGALRTALKLQPMRVRKDVCSIRRRGSSTNWSSVVELCFLL